MADYTENYNLKKPLPEDFVNIADINGNMDLIDEALKTHTHDTATTTKNGFMSAGQVKQLALRATKTELENHVNNNGVHVTAAEKESWNGKADGAHTHEVATTTKDGFMSKEQVVELADKADKTYVDDAIADLDQTTYFTNVTTGNRADKVTTTTTLSDNKTASAAATVGNYALFGNVGSYSSAIVNAYDANLTRMIPTELSQARTGNAATTVGNYALFAGGSTSSSSSGASTRVDAYDTSLTRTTPTTLNKSSNYIVGATVGSYAIFPGYYVNGYNITAYDTSLTKSTPTALSTNRYNLGAAAVGSYALFAGGKQSNHLYGIVDAYDASLTRSTPTALDDTVQDVMGATVGNYAVLAGGGSTNVSAYNTSLTMSTLTAFSSYAKKFTGSTTVGGYAFFTGGDGSSGSRDSEVYAYDTSLTRKTITSLSQSVSNVKGATVGDYALFAGESVADAYGVIVATMPIPAYSKYYFQGITTSEETTIQGKTISSTKPLTGYVKKITSLSGHVTIN